MRKTAIYTLLFSFIASFAIGATYLNGDAVRSPDRTKTWTMPAATGTLSCVACTESPTNKTIAIGSNTWTGQFTVANGGTGASSLTANGVLVGNGTSAVSSVAAAADSKILQSHVSGPPTWEQQIALGGNGGTSGTIDLLGGTSGTIRIQPQAAAGTYNFNLPTSEGSSGQFLTSGGGGSTAMTWTSQSSITSLGTITSGTWQGTAIGDDYGGTGQSTYTTGDMLYASGTNTLAKLAVGSSGQVIKSVGGVPTWATFSGGINYVSSNPDAESDTTGWTTYDDAAATPVDLTGGSFGGTFARSTSSPLRGSASFLYTPGSIGEGVAFTITPERSDYGNVLECSMDAEYVTATAAEGDYQLWVYDVANSTLIQPAGYKFPGAVAGSQFKFKATFQLPTNATTVRIGIHQVTATSAALKFDNVSCGPQVKSYGPFVSDWNSFTPTGAWSSNTTYTGYWRRVGSDAEYRVLVSTSGAPTSATLTVNLPSGHVIDTTKLPSTGTQAVIGWLKVNDSGSAVYHGDVRYSSTTAVVAINQGASGTYVNQPSVVDQATPITFGAGDYVEMYFKVPISGWSSGQLLSSDSGDSRVVAYRSNATPTSSAFNDTAYLIFGTTLYDTHAAYDTGTGLFTAPVAGYYSFSGQFGITGSSAGTYCDVTAYVDGVSKQVFNPATLVTGEQFVPIAYDVYLNAGQTVGFRWNTNKASAAVSGGSIKNTLNIKRISTGNQQIAASESVSVVYETNAAQSISNAGGPYIIDFEDKVKDSHGSSVTTGASWKFTAPVSGMYDVSSMISFGAAAYTAGNDITFVVYKNGSSHRALNYWYVSATNTQAPTLAGTTQVQLLAGDYIDIRVNNNRTGGSSSLLGNATYNYISIKRVGNY